MKKLQLALVAFLVLGTSLEHADAQCCLGAQDIVSTSIDGQYRVSADSLTGTGPKAHGPYHFRFRFQKKSELGKYEQLHQFELKWDTHAHFGMKLMVSPTGNGFAVLFPSEQLAIYRSDGLLMYKSKERLKFSPEADGYCVTAVEIIRFGRSGLGVEDSKIFLPLASKVTKMLDYQAIWYLFSNPERLNREIEEILAATRRLHSSTPEVRAKSHDAILRYGVSAIPILKKAATQTSDTKQKERIASLLQELLPWTEYSGPDGWRDLGLVAALLYYPDAEVSKRARVRLESWLEVDMRQKSVDDLHDWVLKNR
ncbi:MAG: hypothetical protein AAF394_18160, partial [Planctomycetota bacterium]